MVPLPNQNNAIQAQDEETKSSIGVGMQGHKQIKQQVDGALWQHRLDSAAHTTQISRHTIPRDQIMHACDITMTLRPGGHKLSTNMSATLEVIDSHLAELEVTVGGLVNAISNDCCSKGILSDDVCKSLTKSTKPKRERSKTLLAHVRNCIREDESKAELFILILAKYKHCQGLVSKIRKHQADIEDRAKIGQPKDCQATAFPMHRQNYHWTQCKTRDNRRYTSKPWPPGALQHQDGIIRTRSKAELCRRTK